MCFGVVVDIGIMLCLRKCFFFICRILYGIVVILLEFFYFGNFFVCEEFYNYNDDFERYDISYLMCYRLL